MSDAVENMLSRRSTDYYVTSGCRVRANEINGYFSYQTHRNPAQDTIDIVLDLYLQDNLLNISSYIAHSNGPIIKDVEDTFLCVEGSSIDADEIRSVLDSIAAKITGQIGQPGLT